MSSACAPRPIPQRVLFSLKPVDRQAYDELIDARRRRAGVLRRNRRLVVHPDQYPDDRSVLGQAGLLPARRAAGDRQSRRVDWRRARSGRRVASPSTDAAGVGAALAHIAPTTTRSSARACPSSTSTSISAARSVGCSPHRRAGGARVIETVPPTTAQVLVYFVRAGAPPTQTRFMTPPRLQPAGWPRGLPGRQRDPAPRAPADRTAHRRHHRSADRPAGALRSRRLY